jgi:hypothetical protein
MYKDLVDIHILGHKDEDYPAFPFRALSKQQPLADEDLVAQSARI